VAIRHSADYEYLLYSGAGPSLPCTVMMWVSSISNLGADKSYFRVATSGSVGYYVTSSAGDGSHWTLLDETSVQSAEGSAISYDGSWIHLTMVVRSAASNNVQLYLNGVSDILHSYSGTPSAPIDFRIGGGSTGRDGRAAHAKVWSGVELTTDQMLAEMRRSLPVNLSGLWGWWPLLDISDLKDYSGAGRTLVMTGTHETEDGPPVGWGAAPLWVGNPPPLVWYDHEGVAPWSSIWRAARV
jgi:hypothetical protein